MLTLKSFLYDILLIYMRIFPAGLTLYLGLAFLSCEVLLSCSLAILACPICSAPYLKGEGSTFDLWFTFHSVCCLGVIAVGKSTLETVLRFSQCSLWDMQAPQKERKKCWHCFQGWLACTGSSRAVLFSHNNIFIYGLSFLWDTSSAVGRASVAFYLGMHVNWDIFIVSNKINTLIKMFETQPFKNFKKTVNCGTFSRLFIYIYLYIIWYLFYCFARTAHTERWALSVWAVRTQ